MSILVKMLKQKAVYWAKSGTDVYGSDSWSSAAEVSVRWEGKAQLYMDSKQVQRVSTAVVYVGSDVVEGGWLWQGTLLSLPSGSVDPRKVVGAYEIKAFNKTPNLKCTAFLRCAFL